MRVLLNLFRITFFNSYKARIVFVSKIQTFGLEAHKISANRI